MTGDQITSGSWKQELAAAIRSADDLVSALDLPRSLLDRLPAATGAFPLLVPRDFVDRMEKGNPDDPLLRQVLPLPGEDETTAGFDDDPLREREAHTAPGLLQKYRGRALLVAAGSCAVHCRYCFRRSFPYGDLALRPSGMEGAVAAIEADDSLREVILSGGDPLLLSDEALGQLVRRLAGIPHLRRLRVHSRLPVVLPSRVTETLLDLLTGTRLTPVLVIHANHPRELVGRCAEVLLAASGRGLPVLNQAVLLRAVNDDEETLAELSERLLDLRVVPYYLHQLDRVRGTAHFEVPEARGRELIAALRRRLPGYAVPGLVREVPGKASKIPLA